MEEDNNNDDDNNIDENQYQQQQQQQQQVEQQRQVDANGDDIRVEDEDDAIAAIFVKLNTIVERRKEFPLRQRNKIVELAEDYLEHLEDDIHEMLCDQNVGENYRGLDSNRDTEAEVETAIRFYPNTLSRRKDVVWDEDEDGEEGWVAADDEEGEYPIQCILKRYIPNNPSRYNLKAASFIAFLARLGKELNQFQEHERGGLLCNDRNGKNSLIHLVYEVNSSKNEEHDLLVDNVMLTQLIDIRRMVLFKKEDIQEYGLVLHVCLVIRYFSERRFRFLVEMDPSSLLQTYDDNDSALTFAAQLTYIQGFRVYFEYIIRYYPNKKGIMLLFTKNNSNRTPFQLACEKYGRHKVMEIVEDILARYSEETPLNIVEALVMAADNDNVHLDCSYFLLRREPDALVRLLSGSHTNNNDDDDDNDGDNDDDNDHDGGCEVEGNHDDIDENVGEDDDDNDDDGMIITNNRNKRKRES